MFARAGVYLADHIARYLACFLQQSHISAHLHQLAPGVVALGNVPTHNRRDQLVVRLLGDRFRPVPVPYQAGWVAAAAEARSMITLDPYTEMPWTRTPATT